MFGSNFPIEKLWTTYDQLVAAVRHGLADLSEDEAALVMGGVAREFYRLGAAAT